MCVCVCVCVCKIVRCRVLSDSRVSSRQKRERDDGRCVGRRLATEECPWSEVKDAVDINGCTDGWAGCVGKERRAEQDEGTVAVLIYPEAASCAGRLPWHTHQEREGEGERDTDECLPSPTWRAGAVASDDKGALPRALRARPRGLSAQCPCSHAPSHRVCVGQACFVDKGAHSSEKRAIPPLPCIPEQRGVGRGELLASLTGLGA
jgi:hypothetical protein